VNTLRRLLRAAFVPLERGFDRLFGPLHNPLNQLGALGLFFFVIVIASGVHLYIGFDTSVRGAYRSVEMLSRSAWFLFGVERSLHRYASDALVLVMGLHLLREFSLDRYRGARWFSWAIGMPILVFVYVSGITGYWLVWDRLAQYIAVATTEWLDWLPVFGEPIARNFLTRDSLDDRFFSLLMFLHIAVPLILAFVLWLHLQRISRPQIVPPRAMAAGAAAMLLGLSIAFPAVSQGEADLGTVIGSIGLDWFYLPLYPLFDLVPPGLLWALCGIALLVLAALPWLPPLRRHPAAVVDLDFCNGCGRCAEDCPYAAITMAPRTDGKPFERQAAVSPSLCVSCGICMGACPPSTPFRSTPDLRTGIDLPQPSLRELREMVRQAAARIAAAERRILVFGCAYGAAAAQPQQAGVATVILPCVGMLPPSFIDHALSRNLADGVMLAGCNQDDCYNRLGLRWTEARLARQRDPRLRARVPRERLATCWAARHEPARLTRDLAAFTTRLSAMRQPAQAASEPATESAK
jgi:quinol-cytochrome oxidoreductase complex cytochrome b subunit/coenzyme F420-reducing hydrogenase delta subunit/Pyruvate/2-oxoacid:ferredoxin oxidoreductase delta subunit